MASADHGSHVPAADEPSTPLWLPALGALFFLIAGIGWATCTPAATASADGETPAATASGAGAGAESAAAAPAPSPSPTAAAPVGARRVPPDRH
jgi:hypothetical protein